MHGVRCTRGRAGGGREPRDHHRWRERLPRLHTSRMAAETRPAVDGRGAARALCARRAAHHRRAIFAAGRGAAVGGGVAARIAGRRRRRRSGGTMNGRPKNFAIIGVGGYIAPRHLKAIQETGNRVVAAADPHDAVGILDRFAFDVRYFNEIERFDRHLEKLRRGPAGQRIDYVTICSPNHLHDAHIRLSLRVGADAICEKPLVINPWNLDALQEIERETGRRVYTVLQLRVHPQLVALRERLLAERSMRHDVCLTYITARGSWYDVSWKGRDERSGGIVTNIGIHFFDLLIWLFGAVRSSVVNLRGPHQAAGVLDLERA